MVLIIGGAASGKRTFAESLGYPPEAFDDGVLTGKPVLCHLERLLLDEHAQADAVLAKASACAVVTCTQMGEGIVPLAAEQRLWRDRVGRSCAKLAQRADTVVYMVCGIPVYLKGEPSCKS